jgi:hypothetical protein
VLGSAPWAKYTGGIGNAIGELIEVKQAFQGASNSSLLFKAGLIGTAAAITSQFIVSIRNGINETEKWNAELKKSVELSDQLSDKQKAVVAGRFRSAIENAGVGSTAGIVAQIENEIDGAKKVLAGLDTEKRGDKYRKNIFGFGGKSNVEMEALDAEISAQKKLIEELRNVRDEAQKQNIDNAKKRADNVRAMWKDELDSMMSELDAGLVEIKSQQAAAEKKAELRKQRNFDRSFAWMMEQDDREIELANKSFQRRNKKDKEQPPSLNAFESRLLSRGNQTSPMDKVAKNTEITNKELQEVRKLQQDTVSELRLIKSNTDEPAEGF